MQKKIFLIFILAVTNVWSQANTVQTDSLKKTVALYREVFWNDLPKPVRWINDYENLYSDNQKAELNKLITDFEKETSAEIAVVTIDTIKVAREKFEDLSLHLAQAWAIGKYKKDNGILIAISAGYRKMRIQNGNGIELIFTDEETQKLIDNFFIPDFKKGNYFSGTMKGLRELMRILRNRFK